MFFVFFFVVVFFLFCFVFVVGLYIFFLLFFFFGGGGGGGRERKKNQILFLCVGGRGGIIPTILWYVSLRGYFWGMSYLIGIFRSLQNIAFCKVFCDVFTKNEAFYYFCKQTSCVNYGITGN